MPTDTKRKVLNVNIILYGPPQAGKTSNIQFIHRIIHRKLKPNQRGRISTLCQDGYPHVSYEFLPIELGELKGIETNLYIYSAPAHEDGLETRLNLLNEAAGVVFIVDSHPERVEENLESLANLKEELQWWDLEYDAFPVVIQYNKRDLPQVATIDELESQINPEGKPYFEAVASAGQGVRDTFALISKMAVRRARLQLIAREKAAKQKEKIRSEVEAAQFERTEPPDAASAERRAPEAPAELRLATEPPHRPGAAQGESPEADDSQELVHEAEREVSVQTGASESPSAQPNREGSSDAPPDEREQAAPASAGAMAEDAGGLDENEKPARGREQAPGRDPAVAEASTRPIDAPETTPGSVAEVGTEEPEPAPADEPVAETAQGEPAESDSAPPAPAGSDEETTGASPGTTGEADGAGAAPIDMDEPDAVVSPPDDFLKTAFSFDDSDTPFVVDSMDVGDAVLAADGDDVGVIAAGAEEDEVFEDEEEDDGGEGAEVEDQPIALRDTPSLGAIPFVPDLSGEPDVHIQTYADEDDDDEGPIIRLGARAMEEELQLDEDMLLDDAEEELDLIEESDLDDTDHEAPEDAAGGMAEQEPGDEEGDRPAVEETAEDTAGGAPPREEPLQEEIDIGAAEGSVEESPVVEETADRSGDIDEAAAEPAEAPPLMEDEAATDGALEIDQDEMMLDEGPEAAPSESTLDLPEEAVDQGEPPGGEADGVPPEEAPAQAPEEAPGVQDAMPDTESAAPAEPPVSDLDAEPPPEQGRMAPDDEVIFESIVEEPVEAYEPPESIEEPSPLPELDRGAMVEETGDREPPQAEVVSWGETIRVGPSTLRLPVVVKLPGREAHVALAVTIHVDELTGEG